MCRIYEAFVKRNVATMFYQEQMPQIAPKGAIKEKTTT